MVIQARVVGIATVEKLRDAVAGLSNQVGKAISTNFAEGLPSYTEGQQQQDSLNLTRNLGEYSAYLQAKSELDEAYQRRRMEGEQRLAKEESGILQNSLAETGSVTGGLAGLFQDLYNLTGRRQKEFFHLAKAAAIAEATMNIYQGVTKALAQGGMYGYAMAAVVAAQGTAALGRIFAQSLAEGGMVKGWSPSKSADNIPARLTAGEFVMPVDAVKRYGVGFFEALRRQAIPDEVLMGIRMPNLPVHRPAHASFAAGGSVSMGLQESGRAKEKIVEITQINVMDPRELDTYLASKRGGDMLLNVMSSRAGTVRKILGMR